MFYIRQTGTDPWFNIASEEYILKFLKESVVLLWINDPCVVIGKHQNPFAEVNFDFIKKHQLPVIRRISGGGTVFHDRGNLNFTLIETITSGNLVDFEKFMRPVIQALQMLGLDARREGRNDIRINGLKISGNAEHVYKNRVLHHGTLLFDSNLRDLEEALKPSDIVYTGKAIQSVRSKVTNISSHLSQKLSMEEFVNFLEQYLLEWFPAVTKREFSQDEMSAIWDLAEKKYKSWEWNFGYSPEFQLSYETMTAFGPVHLTAVISGGIIKSVSTTPENPWGKLVPVLMGQKYDPGSLKQILVDFVNSEQNFSTNYP